MKRLLVVPKRLSRTPDDAWVGRPGLFHTDIDLVEVSCIFTWEREECEMLSYQWEPRAKKVVLGGPGLGDPGGEFEPGRFIKSGNVITSRGCPFKCPWCYVPDREGGIREINITEGNIVQDNNLLACSRQHIEKVFEMLKGQRAVEFAGGLDARLLKAWHIEALRGLKLKQLFVAYDDPAQKKQSLGAIRKLAKVFRPDIIRCFVMIGRNETIDEATERLEDTWNAGALPFAQVYDKIRHEKPWRDLGRLWSRPAAMRTMMKLKEARGE